MNQTHRLFTLLATLLFIFQLNQTALAGGNDEFGISISPNIEKTLIDGLGISMEGEIRSRDMSKALERLALGVYLGYKPIPYFKAEVGYTFIDQFKAETVTDEGLYTDKYWAPKHETEVSLFGLLPVGVMEFSIRERYEYTYHQDVHAKQWQEGETHKSSHLVKASKTEHVLRSRFQISAKIPDTGFSTYGSLDVYNNLADSGELFNFRLIFGGDYAITNAHKIGTYVRADLFYGVRNNYLLGFKYKYSF